MEQRWRRRRWWDLARAGVLLPTTAAHCPGSSLGDGRQHRALLSLPPSPQRKFRFISFISATIISCLSQQMQTEENRCTFEPTSHMGLKERSSLLTLRGNTMGTWEQKGCLCFLYLAGKARSKFFPSSGSWSCEHKGSVTDIGPKRKLGMILQCEKCICTCT